MNQSQPLLRPSHLLLLALALPLPLAGVGCGSGSGGTLRGTTVARVVEAPADSVARYETASSPEPAIGTERSQAIAAGVRAAAEARGLQVEGDGRLALLAAWTAEHLGDGGAPPPHDVVEFFARHLGLVEPVPHLLILGQPDPATLQSSIEDSVSQFLARHPYNRWGAVAIERQGLTLAVVTLSSRHVELEPIPRHLPEGATIELRGRLTGSHASPTVVVARPDGSVERLSAGSSQRVSASVPTVEPGEYKVEILGEGPRGDTVIANFPLYVGVDVPTSVTLAPDDATGGAAEDVVEALFRLVNQTRRDAGLPPLEFHDGLGEIAEAHSREMVDHNFVGHTSPTTGDAPARVRAAGYRSGLILENIGRGYSPTEIHRGLLASPGHRANIMNPDVTHVGIGVVAEPEGRRMAYIATQVFLRMGRQVDTSQAPEQLLEQINAARRARGAPPLESDENLADAAQQAAERFFAEPDLSQQEVVDEASSGLRRFGLAWSRVGGLMVAVTTLEEAARLEPTFDPEVGYVGIGVAQGTRPDEPPNSLAVVILLAWPR